MGGNLWLNLPSVCRGQSISGTVIAVNLELLDAVHALECGEALQRHFRRAGHKLQELGPVSLVEGAKRSPEPLDLYRRGRDDEERLYTS